MLQDILKLNLNFIGFHVILTNFEPKGLFCRFLRFWATHPEPLQNTTQSAPELLRRTNGSGPVRKPHTEPTPERSMTLKTDGRTGTLITGGGY